MSHPVIRLVPAFLVAGLALAPGVRAQWAEESLTVARQAVGSVGHAGRVWVAGGRIGGASQDTIDIYDPATGALSTAKLSVARSGLAAVGVDRWVLFAGGRTGAAGTTDVIDIYDTVTDTWSTYGLTTPREQIGATAVGGKAFFAGGAIGSLFAPTASDVVDIYDSALGAPDDPAAWSTKTLAVARSGIAATAVGDQALFAGGIVTAGTTVNQVDVYDAGDDQWSTATLSQARLLSPRAAASTTTRAYFAGGQVSQAVLSDVVDVYDVTDGSWSTETLTLQRVNHAVTVVGGRLLVAGGFAATGTTKHVEVYDEALGAWRPPTQLSEPRGDLVAASAGGVAVFATGFGSSVSDAVDVYDPTWSDEGSALAGASGEPQLNGQGSLAAGSANGVALTEAASNALAGLFVATGSAAVPFKGGTLKPFPFLPPVITTTSGAGSIDLPFVMPAAVPPGTELWMQWAVQDGGAVKGIALSKAIMGLTP